MEREQYLDSLARDSEGLADAALAAGTDAPVPTCPGWAVGDLLGHLVSGDIWARTIVGQAQEGIVQRVDRGPAPEGIEGEALVQEFRDGARILVDTLASADPTAPAWTFSRIDRTVMFWVRRRAHETAVHRYDVEAAAGRPRALASELAVDGIDEFLEFFLPRQVEGNADAFAAIGDGSIHLHCTDADGEWLIVWRDGTLTVTREHAKGDVAARGAASDLVLFLWGRVPADELETFGDTELLGRFRSAIKV